MAKPMQTYLFFRDGMFYPIEEESDEKVLKHVPLNPATTAAGKPWPSEKEMQTAVSHFLRDHEEGTAIEPGSTLHGLRVSYAAELGRDGSSDSDVAAALGDRSEAMGKHYTRHVQNEVKVIRAFERKGRK